MDALIVYLLLAYLFENITIVCGETIVSLTAPVNPVEEHGILSIQCQVWDLTKIHEVNLLKITDGISNRLAVDGDVLPSVDDNVFLAQRTRPDGSVIFFLSVIDVERSDRGLYKCEVRSKAEGMNVIAEQSIEIDMLFFPSENGPICQPEGPLDILENTTPSFRCFSEQGNPPIELQWIRAGTESVVNSDQKEVEGRAVSNFRPLVTMRENGAIYFCKVTSPSFPDQFRTCHVGPLTVISNPNNNHVGNTDDVSVQSSPTIGLISHENPNVDQSNPPTWSSDMIINCENQCSYDSPSILYWILATIAVSVIALTFLCISIILFVKFSRLSGPEQDDYVSVEHRREQIYVDLETKPSKEKVYMGLQLHPPPGGTPMRIQQVS